MMKHTRIYCIELEILLCLEMFTTLFEGMKFYKLFFKSSRNLCIKLLQKSMRAEIGRWNLKAFARYR